MKPLDFKDLSELIPESAEFKLRITGKIYHLRPVTLADESWMAKTFGKEVDKIVDMSPVTLSRVVFRLMTEESKKDFLEKDVTFIDESGHEIHQKLGGSELLLHCISGVNEKIEVMQAFLQTLGISRPMQDEIIKEEEKKNQVNQSKTSIGGKLSTSSAQNMDGLQNISSVVRSGNSHIELKPSRKERIRDSSLKQ